MIFYLYFLLFKWSSFIHYFTSSMIFWVNQNNLGYQLRTGQFLLQRIHQSRLLIIWSRLDSLIIILITRLIFTPIPYLKQSQVPFKYFFQLQFVKFTRWLLLRYYYRPIIVIIITIIIVLLLLLFIPIITQIIPLIR